MLVFVKSISQPVPAGASCQTNSAIRILARLGRITQVLACPMQSEVRCRARRAVHKSEQEMRMRDFGLGGLMLVCATAAYAASDTVHVSSGSLQGEELRMGGTVFKGIPYAAPP